jgi:hypothetical protein
MTVMFTTFTLNPLNLCLGLRARINTIVVVEDSCVKASCIKGSSGEGQIETTAMGFQALW